MWTKRTEIYPPTTGKAMKKIFTFDKVQLVTLKYPDKTIKVFPVFPGFNFEYTHENGLPVGRTVKLSCQKPTIPIAYLTRIDGVEFWFEEPPFFIREE